MKTVLFCIPLKKGSLEGYKAFAKETVVRADEYKGMLTRYDISCAKTWHKNIGGSNYIFVYHEVGPDFEEKMQGWDTSEHPFDKWFRESMMESYDIENASGMEQPEQLVEIYV